MAPGIGQRLREARIRRGIELSRVEQVTKICAKYLCAMEEDRWELLPGHAYARGFLSTYAGFPDSGRRLGLALEAVHRTWASSLTGSGAGLAGNNSDGHQRRRSHSAT
jgi:hypothetical protein